MCVVILGVFFAKNIQQEKYSNIKMDILHVSVSIMLIRPNKINVFAQYCISTIRTRKLVFVIPANQIFTFKTQIESFASCVQLSVYVILWDAIHVHRIFLELFR